MRIERLEDFSSLSRQAILGKTHFIKKNELLKQLEEYSYMICHEQKEEWLLTNLN